MLTETVQKAVFFDVDDTLYDHLAPLRKALQDVLSLPEDMPYGEIYHRFRYYSDLLSEEKNLSAVPEDAALADMRRRRFMLALAEFGVFITENEAEAAQAAYVNSQFLIQPFPGAMDLMENLTRLGVKVGLITNGPEEHQQKKLEALQVERYIPKHHIFVSGGVGYAKPDVRLFEHANKITGTTPEHSYYVGDSWRNDVVGAIDAGWTVLWFNHRDALPESDHTPHFTVHNYDEIAERLLLASQYA
ncbi:HAD family hydrolase [Paenibacillus sp. Marseille-Q4541]|uniref:HAD family hydrolase n=1 Tax=Paenibacillus sp. Marseille-Q4541 TaxID=2831522 RepID=UPI001BA795EC|nr:HAD family hydrolase [Paenibacillus sp. Marseille-Q4541]